MVNVIVLTKDEEDVIERCLRSVKWADEVVVVDDQSKDKTVDLAKKLKARVLTHKLEDFAAQRDWAAKKAKEKWLFYLDADEVISPPLAKKIMKMVKENRYSAYRILREHILLGKLMKHGGWYPDYQIRLIKKESLSGWQGAVHETPIVKGEIGQIEEAILHRGHRHISRGIKKTICWSQIEASLLFKAGHPKVRIWHLLKAALSEFFSRYIFKLGFLDGLEGYLEAAMQAFNRFIVYAMLWEKQNNIKYQKSKIKNTN